MPVSSLPAPFGIGDFGPAAYQFVDWLKQAHQSYWQVLPLTIPDSVGSPYSSSSALAGNWLFISPELLRKAGLLSSADYPTKEKVGPVNLLQVRRQRWTMLYRSFLYAQTDPKKTQRLEKFIQRESSWLEDYVLFQALKDQHRGRPWWQWAQLYQSQAVAWRNLTPKLSQRMAMHRYIQWLFEEQWQDLKQYAHGHGLKIIGDLPFLETLDSVDVWAHPQLFLLDRRRRPKAVAGVPPDYYSSSGQKWGNPLYAWPAHRRQNFSWWLQHFAKAWSRFDSIRFDHFLGLTATWQLPTQATNGRRGRWVASPGLEILGRLKKLRPTLPIVAEDLGFYSPANQALRQKFHIPGSRVLLFGWSGIPQNMHHPGVIQADSVVYTSTHDTNTVRGWRERDAGRYDRLHLQEFLGPVAPAQLPWKMIEVAYQTPARVAIVPLADVLALDQRGRINTPGTKRGNWRWRVSSAMVTPGLAKSLADVVQKNKR